MSKKNCALCFIDISICQCCYGSQSALRIYMYLTGDRTDHLFRVFTTDSEIARTAQPLYPSTLYVILSRLLNCAVHIL